MQLTLEYKKPKLVSLRCPHCDMMTPHRIITTGKKVSADDLDELFAEIDELTKEIDDVV